MPAGPEARLQHQIVRDLGRLGLLPAEIHSTRLQLPPGVPEEVRRAAARASKTTPGFPDLAVLGPALIVCPDCRVAFAHRQWDLLELKAPHGSLNENQREFHALCAAHGYEVPVIHGTPEMMLWYSRLYGRRR